MLEWIDINTPKIKKIGYNAELKIMYLDFCGSKIDVPFKNITEETFRQFIKAKNVDEYYENSIRKKYERVDISTENLVACGLDK